MKTTVKSIGLDFVEVEYATGKSTKVPVSIDVDQTGAEIKASVEEQAVVYLRSYLRGKKEEEALAARAAKVEEKLQNLVGKTIRVPLKEDGSDDTTEEVTPE